MFEAQQYSETHSNTTKKICELNVCTGGGGGRQRGGRLAGGRGTKRFIAGLVSKRI